MTLNSQCKGTENRTKLQNNLVNALVKDSLQKAIRHLVDLVQNFPEHPKHPEFLTGYGQPQGVLWRGFGHQTVHLFWVQHFVVISQDFLHNLLTKRNNSDRNYFAESQFLHSVKPLQMNNELSLQDFLTQGGQNKTSWEPCSWPHWKNHAAVKRTHLSAVNTERCDRDDHGKWFPADERLVRQCVRNHTEHTADLWSQLPGNPGHLGRWYFFVKLKKERSLTKSQQLGCFEHLAGCFTLGTVNYRLRWVWV